MNLLNSKLLVVLYFLLSASLMLNAQNRPNMNWQNLDLSKDSLFGISTNRAYNELLKAKKSKMVVVAVLDGGVDINHEDLKKVIWQNPKEIAGNGKDDDKNGYVDDTYGWNFLGSEIGNARYDNLETTRAIARAREKFKGKDSSTVSESDMAEYENYIMKKNVLDRDYTESVQLVKNLKPFKAVLDSVTTTINKGANPSLEDFKNFKPGSVDQAKVRAIMLQHLGTGQQYKDIYAQQIAGLLAFAEKNVDYHLNMDYNPRAIIGDDNTKGRFYGNKDVFGPEASHGTHVAGIIAAIRDNNIGMDGIADNVKIMVLRNVPDGDERDKDVANAIRYAADNGASIINMSFGKSISPEKSLVDDAVKYAISKDVLIIHAAGNENKNIDSNNVFPSRDYLDKSGSANAWIEVGASQGGDNASLKANFSNYGKNSVDVFAPGSRIYSTIPGNKYEPMDGTSMAAPVVSGLAALIRSYYPKLKAEQVKEIIMKSVVKVAHPVNVSVGQNIKSVPFADLCISGGIINVLNAMKLAATYK